MLKSKIFSIAAILILLVFSACKEEVNSPSAQMNEQMAVQKSLTAVQGSITSVTKIRSNDDNLWEVKVTTSAGAVIKFEYFENTGVIREIHGMSGPFDYNLDPGNGLMLYQDVRAIALNAKDGNITSWKLEKDESDNRWEYRFFITASDGNWELRIHAQTGQILRIK